MPAVSALNDKERPLASQDRPLPSLVDGVIRPRWGGTEQGLCPPVASDNSPRVPSGKEAGRTNIFGDKGKQDHPLGATSLETWCPSCGARVVVNREAASHLDRRG